VKNASKALLTLFVILVLACGSVYAKSPALALKNPLYLTLIDRDRMVYATYSMKSGEAFISYSEYDTEAEGFGVLAVTASTQGAPMKLSFVATKEFGMVDMAFGIHRAMGEDGVWLLDLALGGSIDKLSLRAGIHQTPLTSWEDIQENLNFSVGASVKPTENITIGADIYPGEEWSYAVHAAFSATAGQLGADIGGNVTASFLGSGFESADASLWFSKQQILLELGCGVEQGPELDELVSGLRVGAGFRF